MLSADDSSKSANCRVWAKPLKVYLVNPSDKSFGIGVITPRWLYVLAAATPSCFGDPVIIDETLAPLDVIRISAGDIVGIGIHSWAIPE